MEYLIRSAEPFEQLEARVVGAIGRHGITVQRSFSLHSATAGEFWPDPEAGGGPPGYSVLWLYTSGASRRPLAMVTLYQQRGRTIFHAVPAVAGETRSGGVETADLEAELVAALVLDGLEICLGLDGRRGCVDAARVADGATTGPERTPQEGGPGFSATSGGPRSALVQHAE